MPLVVLSYAIEYVIQTGFLLLALWVMIKIQKLDYNFLGLLGTAMLGSGLDMIPFIGHFIAVAALYICIWKVTRADLFPDAVFTVLVSYALTFCMNLFLIGALMDDLRPSSNSSEPLDSALMEVDGSFDTNETAVSDSETAEEAGGMATPAEYSVKSESAHSPQVSLAPASQKQPPVPSSKSSAPSQQPQLTKSAAEFVMNFRLKGVTGGGNKSIATFQSGNKTYTIGVGEALSVPTASGRVEVRCEEAARDSVILSVDGERVQLYLQ